MSRQEKLLQRLLKRPKDFTYIELTSLLEGLNCSLDQSGKTGGSRIAFIHAETKTMLRLHRPHPGNELKAYQIDLVIHYLKNIGVI